MKKVQIPIRGKLLGRYLSVDNGTTYADIVHIENDYGPDGPAENAFVFIEVNHNVSLN